MIIPVLKHLSVGIYLEDIDKFVPKDPTHFKECLDVTFGPSDSPGEENFDIYVCSPSWIEKMTEDGGIFFPRHYLVMKEFDAKKIRDFITGYATKSAGAETWHDVGLKLSRIGFWEFEDYRPHKPSNPTG